MKSMTHEEFVSRVKIVLGDEYEVLGKYVNQGTEIEIKHYKCGYVRKVKPREILRTKKGANGERIPNPTKCPKCNGNIKKTTNDYKKEVHDLYGDEYTVLGEYKNNKNGILTRHNICGYEWSPSPVHFLSGNSSCPNCSRKKTHSEFITDVYNLVGNEYVVLSKYIDDKHKILMRHNCDKCNNYEWEIIPSSFTSHLNRCPKCSNIEKTKTHEYYIEEVNKLAGDEYTVLGKYINAETKILMKHNSCGHEWEITPINFRAGRRCPKCAIQKESKGELELRKYIESLIECKSKSDSVGILDGKDIDILTANNIGFEYNGEYWHSEGNKVPIGYHKEKTIKAKEKGIILYHIWERNWINRQEEVKEFIRKALSKG